MTDCRASLAADALLPHLLEGRHTGPVFLTGRRARVELPPGALDPGSGRAQLSYRRAAELFETPPPTYPAARGLCTSCATARSLARCARVSQEALARRQQARALAARRR
ncbi:hypothetical protein GCM10010404_86290 [Nonomuraea africana]|uniref:Uncharacterized protein n=1 Tax=Nonomuraea africana TaxID=46171 RepID=A0ABR9KA03_9ACTN|nr:hypothetical protein [Nonomuraea africana]MBE1558819.1 hypothetical protein [Nonomuraea africana]